MSTIPTDELRTKQGTLSRAGIVLMAIALVLQFGWIAWNPVLAN